MRKVLLAAFAAGLTCCAVTAAPASKPDCQAIGTAQKRCTYRTGTITTVLTMRNGAHDADTMDIDNPDTGVEPEKFLLWMGLMMWRLDPNITPDERGAALQQIMAATVDPAKSPVRFGAYDWTRTWSGDKHLMLHAVRRPR